MPRSCNCVDTNECEEVCNTTCYSCGLPACRNCSIVVPKYYDKRDKRICTRCLPERFVNGEQWLQWHRYKLAGYEVGTEPALYQTEAERPVLVVCLWTSVGAWLDRPKVRRRRLPG